MGLHPLAIHGEHAGCRRQAKADQQEPGEALQAEPFPSVEGGANGQIAYDGAAALDEVVEAEIRPQESMAAEDTARRLASACAEHPEMMVGEAMHE